MTIWQVIEKYASRKFLVVAAATWLVVNGTMPWQGWVVVAASHLLSQGAVDLVGTIRNESRKENNEQET